MEVFVVCLQSHLNTRCGPMSIRAEICLQGTAAAFLVSTTGNSLSKVWLSCSSNFLVVEFEFEFEFIIWIVKKYVTISSSLMHYVTVNNAVVTSLAVLDGIVVKRCDFLLPRNNQKVSSAIFMTIFSF